MEQPSQNTTKMISLVPTNGTEFDVTQGQKVIFELPPNLGLLKGRDSHLVLDICNTSSQNNRLALNTMAGCEAIIARVDIYSLRDGTHIETMNNYNMMAAMANQYLYEDKTNLASLQGCGCEVYAKHVVAGATVNVESDSDCVENTQLSPIDPQGVNVKEAYNFRRYVAPLKSGFLGRWWDDELLCPLIAVGGVRVELTLENPNRAFQCIQTSQEDALGNARGNLDPLGTDGRGAKLADNAGGATNTFQFVGTTADALGLCEGNVCDVTGDVGAGQVAMATGRTITQLNETGGNVNVVFSGAAFGAASTANACRLSNFVKTARVRPQWRCVSVAPPQNLISQIGSGMNYEFTTYDYHISSLISSATQHQVELNSVATRAQCIMSNFVDTGLEERAMFSSYFAGGTPAETNLNSVQYFLKNRLQPVRAYNPQTTGERIIAQHELAKSFEAISHEAVDLGNSEGANLNVYTNTFYIGRQLAKRPYYYDLKDAEGQIRLQFSGTRTNNVSINTFVWNKKICSIGAGAEIAIQL